MKKILLLILTLILIAGCSSTQDLKQEVQKKSLNETLLDIIKTNDDAYTYLYNNPTYKILSIETFLPQDKLNTTDFPNEYNNLEDKQYYEVKIKGETDLTLVSIIDLDNQEVKSAFGVFLIGISS